MKILIVSQYFWPEDFRVNDLSSSLVERGHEVTVLTGQPNYPSGIKFPSYRSAPHQFTRYKGANVVRVPIVARGTSKARLILNYFSFAISAIVIGTYKLRKTPFDAIFVYEVSPVTVAIPAIFLRWLRNKRVAMWILDLWPDTLTALGVVRNNSLLACINAMVSWIYDHCDLILMQSEAFRDNIESLVHRPVKIAYLPSWSEDLRSDEDVLPAKEVVFEATKFSVMFAGNIGESQSFPTILDAAELLRDVSDVRWLIVGDGRMFAWVNAEVQRRDLDNVLLLGRHPIEAMPSFYRHADAMLVSLQPEPVFSMVVPAKIQSYLAAAKPVIAMLNGEGARIIERSGAGLTCPAGDGRALADTVLAMMALPREKRDAMGKAGRSYYEQNFDRSTLIGQIEEHLHDLCFNPSETAA